MKKGTSIAIWDDDFLAPVRRAFQSKTSGFDVTVTSKERCEQLVLAGMIDIGLMPSLSVLLHDDDLDVYAGGAISSWKFPYVKLATGGLIGQELQKIEYSASNQSLAVLSRIVLNEHYQLSPKIVPSEQPAISSSESGLIFSADDGTPHGSECILDLGEEWFELTGYPMVWGLFASAKGSHLLRAESSLETVLGAFKVSSERNGADSDDPTTDEFYSGDMRVGYDDLVTASLTDLAQYLYVYKVIEEPVAVPVVSSDEFE